jgi:SAM-dependent methyltransferase
MTDHTDITAEYGQFYRARSALQVYPVEFVVRAFLGNYPRLKNARADHAGKSVLDLGFGDGRNIGLLNDLGMQVSGVEISEDICAMASARLASQGIAADLRVGRNCAIPFADASFDHVLACHACYYVDPNTSFTDNAREIARVLRPGGRFTFSAPMADTYIMRGAVDLGDGHMQIADDPYGVRNGYVLKKFDSAADIERTLSPAFDSFSIGSCRNDFWGISEHVWIVTCRRAAA